MELTAPHPAQWAANADTYAALLYRTGKKEEAIQTEEKAVKALKDTAEKEEAASYEKTLRKMKAGTF